MAGPEIPTRVGIIDASDPRLQLRLQKQAFTFGRDEVLIGDSDLSYEAPQTPLFLATKVSPQTPRTRIGTAPCCIYCGSKDLNASRPNNLSEEHFIPESMGSRLYVANAACETCARLIQRYENQILLSSMFNIKTSMGLRGKKTSVRKGYAQFFAGPAEERTILKLPVSSAPSFLILPKYLKPGRMTLDPPGRSRYCSYYMTCSPSMDEIGQIIGKLGYNTISPPAIDVFGFAQFLAKIAYGYVLGLASDCRPSETGAFNLNDFKFDVLRYVIGSFSNESFDKDIFDFVGGCEQHLAPTNYLHEIGCGAVKFLAFEYLVVDIRLFSYLATPLYRVIVGQRVI